MHHLQPDPRSPQIEIMLGAPRYSYITQPLLPLYLPVALHHVDEDKPGNPNFGKHAQTSCFKKK